MKKSIQSITYLALLLGFINCDIAYNMDKTLDNSDLAKQFSELIEDFDLKDTKRTQYHIGQDTSYLIIGTDATKTVLDSISSEFSSKNIQIDYSGSTFANDGKVKNISIKVTRKNGQGGSFSSSPFKKRGGFIVKENTFSVGSINSLNGNSSTH